MEIKFETVEHAINSSLRSLGYFRIHIDHVTNDRNYLYVEADGTLRKIFLIVAFDDIPFENYSWESGKIRDAMSKAEHEQREPWSAYVKIDHSGNVAESIKWKDLSVV